MHQNLNTNTQAARDVRQPKVTAPAPRGWVLTKAKSSSK